MKLPVPLTAQNAAVWKRLIEQADQLNVKRGTDYETAPGRIILTSPGGNRFVLKVADDGSLSTSPAPPL